MITWESGSWMISGHGPLYFVKIIGNGLLFFWGGGCWRGVGEHCGLLVVGLLNQMASWVECRWFWFLWF